MILQPTLELLTPLLQNPHRLLQLALLADVEALDAMGTFLRATPPWAEPSMPGCLSKNSASAWAPPRRPCPNRCSSR
jgi:hypothetical protein